MKPVILFVDDEAGHRKLFVNAIDEDQFDVILADTADHALQQLSENSNICVVVTDYNMPMKNGLQLLEAVSEKWPYITRIMCTAIADIDVAKNAINVGKVSAYFNKPWDIDELNHKITEAVTLYNENKLNQQLRNINEGLKNENAFSTVLFKANYDQISDLCSAIDGITNHLLDEEADDEKINFLKMASATSRRGLCQVTNLLDYVHIKNNEFSLNLKEAHLHELTEQLLLDYAVVFEQLNNHFNIVLDEELMTISFLLDWDRVYRILAGIITYSLSTGASQQLSLSVKYAGDFGHSSKKWLLFEISYPVVMDFTKSRHLHTLPISGKNKAEKPDDLLGPELELFIANELAMQMDSKIEFSLNPKKTIFSLVLCVNNA